MHNLQKLLDNIPDFKEFLTVDEMDANSKHLASKYPDKVTLIDMGKSREGNTVYCLKIGSGSKSGLMYGCPHPNEPMGAMLIEYLTQAMVEDDAFLDAYDYTWYFIKSIDIDGTKRNEKWFKPPFSVTNYARNFFRPAGYEQVEWTFPIKYKNYTFDAPIPEAKMLMQLIDETKPHFIYSLHNAGFGGTYWYISKEFPDLWNKFYETSESQNVPLHLGEPEVNYVPEFSKAIYKMFGIREMYDYYEKYGENAPETYLKTGTSAHGYSEAQGIDATVLVTELPYFYEPSIDDKTELKITRFESFMEGLDFMLEDSNVIKTYYEQLKQFDNPYFRMVETSLSSREENYESTVNYVKTQESYQRLATVSEDFDNSKVLRFYTLLSWSLLLRGIETELVKNPELKNIFEKVESEFSTRAEKCEALLKYQFIPIQKLVRIQLESGIHLLDELEKNYA